MVVIVSVPDAGPATVGVNVTKIAQVADGATDVH